MKDTTPDDALGYVVVSLPDRGDWQGFFVLPGYAQRGEAMLRDVREANQQAGMQGGTEVNHGLPGLTDADQVAVGSLSAVLAELFAMGLRKPPPAPAQADAIMAGVGAAAWALWKSSGQRWLLVTGTRAPGRNGYATKVRRIEAETFDEAREAMAAAVGAAKQTKAMADEVMDAVRRYGRGGA